MKFFSCRDFPKYPKIVTIEILSIKIRFFSKRVDGFELRDAYYLNYLSCLSEIC